MQTNQQERWSCFVKKYVLQVPVLETPQCSETPAPTLRVCIQCVCVCVNSRCVYLCVSVCVCVDSFAK